MLLDERKEKLLATLMDNYGSDIKRLVYTYVKHKELAEDITQEVFISCYEKLDAFRGEAAYRTWLYRIAINKCKNNQRSWSFRHLIFGDSAYVDFAHQQTGEAEILDQEEKLRVAKAILSLPLKYREVIVLRYYKDFSIAKIAVEMNPKRIEEILNETVLHDLEFTGKEKVFKRIQSSKHWYKKLLQRIIIPTVSVASVVAIVIGVGTLVWKEHRGELSTENRSIKQGAKSDVNTVGNSIGNLLAGGEVAEQGDWVFIAAKGELYKENSKTGEKVRLTSGNVNCINVYGNWVYYTATPKIGDSHLNTKLYKITVDGQKRQVITKSSVRGYFCVADGWIYYGDNHDQYAYRMRIDGTKKQKIGERGFFDHPVFIFDDWIYYQNYEEVFLNNGYVMKNTIYRMRLDGSDKQVLAGAERTDISHVLRGVDEKRHELYYASHTYMEVPMPKNYYGETDTKEDDLAKYRTVNIAAEKLFKMKMDGSAKQPVAFENYQQDIRTLSEYDSIIQVLRIHGDWAYISKTTDEGYRIYRSSLDGSKQQVILDEKERKEPIYAFFVTNHALYYNEDFQTPFEKVNLPE